MIHMQLNSEVLNRVTYLTGSADIVKRLSSVPALVPFSSDIVNFLNDVSREIMQDSRSKTYSDIISFAFWIRKASVLKLKERFNSKGFCLGKGVAFHISPSNVPVNFAYSLVAGLLCGNANVVRVPSIKFCQVSIITGAFNKVLVKQKTLQPYVICVSYDHDKIINDLFSSIADVRIIWGGNQTIYELRKSELPPRSCEITFADRYSLAVIDSDSYLAIEDKNRIAENFYNDTFFSDQNACTSPRLIVWQGNQIDNAKEVFWNLAHKLAKEKYIFQSIQSVNKLAQAYLIAVKKPGVKIMQHYDNLIVRVKVPIITDDIMDYKGNSGFFYEYDCKDILDIIPLCNDKRCQTIAYLGNSNTLLPLLKAGLKGIDRVVPFGRTMDFDLIWDGYNLPSVLTRTIVLA